VAAARVFHRLRGRSLGFVNGRPAGSNFRCTNSARSPETTGINCMFRDDYAWQLPRRMRTFLDRQGHWHDQVTVQQIAVTATQRSGTRENQAEAHRELSVGHTRLGSYDEAYRHLALAIGLYEELGDQIGRADAHQSTALVLERQGEYGEAARHAQQAVAIYRLWAMSGARP
jgi:tetratricopeptide (TPR) repeat protein